MPPALSPKPFAHFPIHLRRSIRSSLAAAAAHRRFTISSAMSTAAATVDHIVLFKVSPSASPTAGADMTAALRALSSLPGVAHLSAGPVLRRVSPAAEALGFTHCLHSRYGSKEDLAAYASHPDHVKVVKELGLPVCEDIMAVDWVFEGGAALLPPPADKAAARLMIGKVKGGLKAEDVSAAVAASQGAVSWLLQASWGENFSPARAKGYTFGLLSVFPALDKVCENMPPEEAKVQEYFEEDRIVVDFLVTTAASASDGGQASL